MRKRTGLILFGICALLVSPASPGEEFLVRLRSKARDIRESADRQGLHVVRALDPAGSTYVVTSVDDLDGESFLSSLSADPDVDAVESVSTVPLPELQSPGGYDFEATIRGWLSSYKAKKLLGSRSYYEYFGDPVWSSYLAQPLVGITELGRAQRMATGRGVTVAVIDTGIANHPALEDSLVVGYDFLRDEPVAGEDDLPVSDPGMPDVQQGTTVVLNLMERPPDGGYWGGGYDAPTLRQYAAVGHGTMIAGVIHLIAPKARLMPLRVFGPDGRTDTATIIRAIYYAVDHDAEVINMSFSTNELSPELTRAIDYATRRGVICVASAGNQARDAESYPASLSNVLGVAATDDNDRRSLFSNFGSKVAKLAAPGEGILTTYLDGAYAVGWGTSFSTALVSGGAALLLDIESLDQFEVAETLSRSAERISRDLGRIDLYSAVQRAANHDCERH
ncbi:MAG TPA: S8 family serine peptidase [Vicinamibacteria bacterium]|nr:S8 family serine peptidase [Vicinamibacteria bacterium]